MKPSGRNSILRRNIKRVTDSQISNVEESLILEEPLEIRITDQKKREYQLAITMRTPGDDKSLVIGFLHSEGIITGNVDIDSIRHLEEKVILVKLSARCSFNLSDLEQRLLMSSSCGICGKNSLESVNFESRNLSWRSKRKVKQSIITLLPEVMNKNQLLFADTGGVHAAAIFDYDGQLLDLREDIGRHNAMDKLIGANLDFDFRDKFILVSGRVSFEICQKAAMAGVPIIGAIGAVSSLAVEVAEQEGITLIGFIKYSGYNVYSCTERLL